MEYQILKENEKFRIEDVYNGYCKPSTGLNIWTEKNKSGESRIVYKKDSSKNSEKTTYSYQWLIIVNNVLYIVSLDMYGGNLKIGNYHKRFNKDVENCLDEEGLKVLKESILNADNEISRLYNQYKKAKEISENKNKRIDDKIKELSLIADDEIKDHILNADNYKPYNYSKAYDNTLILNYTSQYWNVSVRAGLIIRATKNNIAKMFEANKQALKEKLELIKKEHIIIKRDEDNKLKTIGMGNTTILF